MIPIGFERLYRLPFCCYNKKISTKIQPQPVLEVNNMPKNMNLLLNTDWLFHYGPELEGEFSPILLPHTFQLPYYGENEFYVGCGVYKRTLRLTREDLDGLLLLAFEGVFQYVKGWLNGIEIGEHLGGYTPFDLELTHAAHVGDNELILRVDNFWRADLPPRAGEHTFCGGIYREVSLCRLPRMHIRRNGIFIIYPERGSQWRANGAGN